MGHKRVTIVEIAREAGVSAQTVSRVVNGHENVAEETRLQIQTIIDRLGYRPSRLARSLLRGESNTLGVVSFGLGLYAPSQLLEGIVREAKKQGLSVLPTVLFAPDAEDPEETMGKLIEYHVDGVIWAAPQIGNNRNWVLEASGTLEIPTVFLSMEWRPGLSVVAFDNRRGGYLATRHLIDQGNRTIGLIMGPSNWWEAQERARGWRNALQEHDLLIHDDLIVAGDWSAPSGEQSMRLLLQRHPKIDAVFVSNDSMAMGALKVAREVNRKVPDALSIVGFDDIPETAYTCPPLTTIRQDLRAVGQRAVSELMQRLRNPGSPSPCGPILIEPDLVVRSST